MTSIYPIPLLPAGQLGLLSGLIIWGFLHAQSRRLNEALLEAENNLRL